MTTARPTPWHDHLNAGLRSAGGLAFSLSNRVADAALDLGDLVVAAGRRVSLAACDFADGCVLVARIAQGVGQLVQTTVDSMSSAVTAAGEHETGRLRVVRRAEDGEG